MTNENTSIPLHDRIRLIRIQAFFRSASGNPFSLVLGGGLSALALASVGVPAYPLGVWFALILVSCGLIFTFERFVKRRGLTHGNAVPLFRRRVALGLVNATLFGAVIALIPTGAAPTAYLLVFVVGSSVVALGYMSYATEFRYGLAVSALTMAPFALFCFYRYFVSADAFLLLTGIIALVWQAVWAVA